MVVVFIDGLLYAGLFTWHYDAEPMARGVHLIIEVVRYAHSDLVLGVTFMDETLASIAAKLDLIVYCLVGFLILSAFRTYYQARNYIRTRKRDADAEYYGDLLRKEKYTALLEHVDARLNEDAKSLIPTWYKAKTLYVLERFDEARDLFVRVQTIEPDWIDPAQGYIDRIDRMGSKNDA